MIMQQREPRLPIDNGLVELQRASTEISPHEYRLLNISRGGLCFQSDANLELNETLKLNVLIDEKRVLSTNGRVCYRNHDEAHPCYGLSFLDDFIDADFLREKKKAALKNG